MKIKVHEFRMNDVDDVEIYAAEPIWNWQQSDAGKFVMENANEPPVWHSYNDYNTYGTKITIVADLKEKDITYFNLKWGVK